VIERNYLLGQQIFSAENLWDLHESFSVCFSPADLADKGADKYADFVS